MKIIQKENENRKDYLIRVVVTHLKHIDYIGDFITNESDTINYDDADCDGCCLADDLEIEFSHIDFND